MALIVNEIFHSIQGETALAGFSSVFVRLTGCNLKCPYCDTVYARKAGQEMQIDEILQKIGMFEPVNHVTITGGEPLIQRESIILMKRLLEKNYTVQLETNGSVSLSRVPGKVRKIVDVKTPSSRAARSFIFSNLKYIRKNDEIKFVISDKRDYKFSVKFLVKYRNINGTINFSPVHGKMPASELAALILLDRLPVRLNLQLHKIIWPVGEPGTGGE